MQADDSIGSWATSHPCQTIRWPAARRYSPINGHLPHLRIFSWPALPSTESSTIEINRPKTARVNQMVSMLGHPAGEGLRVAPCGTHNEPNTKNGHFITAAPTQTRTPHVCPLPVKLRRSAKIVEKKVPLSLPAAADYHSGRAHVEL